MPDPFASATDLARALRTRALSSRELLKFYIERIERLDGPVNAVVTLAVESALSAAVAADEATAAGAVDWSRRPLHGLPITVKDSIATRGIRSTGGTRELSDHVPTEDAPAVAALREAGAIVFGKTNLARWSADVRSTNEVFGTTRNPHDLTRTPGGSSGGSAVAVAMGFTAFELGTDIGGSIRIPSHFCGVFGLKPSFGVIPQRGYLDRVGGGTVDTDINVFGPLARDAADLEMVLTVLVGPAPELAPAVQVKLPPAGVSDVRGLRVALWFDEQHAPLDDDYRALLAATAARLAEEGAVIVHWTPPVDFDAAVKLFGRMVEAAMSRTPPGSQWASALTHARWLELAEERERLRARWRVAFDAVDVVLCPAACTPAFEHMEGDARDLEITINGDRYPYLANLSWAGVIGIAGLPSVTAPIGRTPGGLPVGVQIVSPYLFDRRSIEVASWIGTFEPPGVAGSSTG